MTFRFGYFRMISCRRGRRLVLPLVLVAAALSLSACAETELAIHTAKWISGSGTGGEARYKIGNPYQIKDVWYYPAEDYEYTETGVASWYGDPFHGRRTANGEIYDMNTLTAAHRTLPLPSIVRVTNLENGRSITVRVNDRGPFARGRIIDMSRRSAQLLGFTKQGTAKVRVEILPEESRTAKLEAQQGIQVASITAAPRAPVTAEALPPPPGTETAAAPLPVTETPLVARAAPAASEAAVEVVPVTNPRMFVQAGAFLQYDNANRLGARLSTLGPAQVMPVEIDGRTFFRVRVGPIEKLGDADRLLDAIIDAGHADAKLIVD